MKPNNSKKSRCDECGDEIEQKKEKFYHGTIICKKCWDKHRLKSFKYNWVPAMRLI